jgi:hypothetical protein
MVSPGPDRRVDRLDVIRDWEIFVLPPRERRIVEALAEALYPRINTKLTEAEHAQALQEVVDDVGAWLGAPNAGLRTAFRALLVPLEMSPALYGLGPRRMSQLPLDERVLYVARMDAADSAPIDAWKNILGLAYFARPVGRVHLELEKPAPVVAAIAPAKVGHAPVRETAKASGSGR